MATVTASSSVTPVGRCRPGAARSLPRRLTLADLVTAVQDVVGPGDDRLVVATVRHLLRSGWVMGRRTDIRGGPPGCQETRVVAGCDRRCANTPARWQAGLSAAGVQIAEETGEASGNAAARSWERGRRVTERFSLCATSASGLVGLGARMGAARPRQGGTGQQQSPSRLVRATPTHAVQRVRSGRDTNGDATPAAKRRMSDGRRISPALRGVLHHRPPPARRVH
jgi:hypothetical protein